MTSYMDLTGSQQNYIEQEGHHAGKRYFLALIDRKNGEVILDYRSEILRIEKEKNQKKEASA